MPQQSPEGYIDTIRKEGEGKKTEVREKVSQLTRAIDSIRDNVGAIRGAMGRIMNGIAQLGQDPRPEAQRQKQELQKKLEEYKNNLKIVYSEYLSEIQAKLLKKGYSFDLMEVEWLVDEMKITVTPIKPGCDDD